MKSDKLILVSLSLLMFPMLCFGQAKVGVDKKIELLGAVYAAAQIGDNPQIRYTELMEEWLPYQERDDEAVAFVREMIENNGLTYSDIIAVSPYIILLDSNFDYGNREEYTITVPKMLQSKKAVSMEKDYEIKYYFR